MNSPGLRWSPILAVFFFVPSCAKTADPVTLTDGDRAQILALDSSFVGAWLRDDTTAVLSAFAPDAVLIPPGGSPVRGLAAIRAYWWPQDGSHTRITAFDRNVTEVDGTSDLGYLRGDATLAWSYEKDGARSAQASRSQDLIVYRRGSDGRWRVIRQMWSTRP